MAAAGFTQLLNSCHPDGYSRPPHFCLSKNKSYWIHNTWFSVILWFIQSPQTVAFPQCKHNKMKQGTLKNAHPHQHQACGRHTDQTTSELIQSLTLWHPQRTNITSDWAHRLKLREKFTENVYDWLSTCCSQNYYYTHFWGKTEHSTGCKLESSPGKEDAKEGYSV